MNRTTFILAGLLAGLLTAPVIHAAGVTEITACDWEAGHPSDPERVGPGKSSSAVDTPRAIEVCKDAVAAHPEEPRFHYQLGRAIVYQADRASSDWHLGIAHLENAADMGHAQAQFVMGLMQQRDQDFCGAEPYTRAAANAGLKSARISYVNEYLSGRFNDCPPRASLEEMASYLEGASEQVSGWYENMLLESLGRQLSAARAQLESR